MSISWKLSLIAPFGFIIGAYAQVLDSVPLKNWSAPLSWQATTASEITVAHENMAAEGRLNPQLQTTGGTQLSVLVAITPCRLVDTRTNMPQPFGSGSSTPLLWTGGSTHTIPVPSGSCSLPGAVAYSANVTVVMPTAGAALSFLTVYPTGTTRPVASNLNNLSGLLTVSNAAVIPTGTPAGSFDVYVTDPVYVIIDINGYYISPNALSLGTGTAAAPSLTFTGDSTSGIYSAGAGTINVATGGANRLTVAPNGNVGIGTTTPGSALDVAGDVNFTGSVRFQGTQVLRFPGGNTALGASTLQLNTTGYRNTAIGGSALFANTSGAGNTAIGDGGLSANTTGETNTAVGGSALQANTTGFDNTATGYAALFSNTVGGSNTASGGDALANNTTGNNNTASGELALYNNTTGNNNIAIGYQAARNVTGGNSNNIHIGTEGASSDSGTIRIGGKTSLGDPAAQTQFFVAGVAGTAVSGVPVLIDTTTGQLGVASSSLRYKEGTQDMADASSDLMRLHPVTFRYKKPFADGSKPIQFGLIAEEVAEVYPDLVARSADGQIETVKYQVLDSMLFNEFQKQHRVVTEQADEIKRLQSRLEALEQLLSTKAPIQ
jgi:hypothetical protein